MSLLSLRSSRLQPCSDPMSIEPIASQRSNGRQRVLTKFEPRISSARSESGGLSRGGCDLRQIYFFGHQESEFSLYRRLKDLRIPLWEFKCEFESAGILPARPRTMEHVFRFECSLESENLIRVISLSQRILVLLWWISFSHSSYC